jgi:alkylation response protein AidB-like acyl-CoA dehydrogenase
MDFGETSEQAMLREAVGRIASKYGHDYFSAKVKSGGRSDELWRDVAAAGFTGVSIPERYGGGGMGIAELAVVAEELATHGCPLMLLMVSPAICGTIIARFGTPEQRDRWLPGLASGERKMVFAITEPEAGSNSHRLATTATREGDGWAIRGTKHFISGVDEADSILVVTRTGTDPASGRGRLSLFIVDTDAPGLTRSVIPLEVAAPEKQFLLFFDGVAVAEDRLLGTEGDGLRQVFNGLNPERIIAAAGANGIGRYALAKAAAYAGQRKVWDAPIGAHQGISHPLAVAKIEVELARLATQKAAWAHDQGRPDAGEVANMAKYAAAEASLHALDAAIQAHGGNGFATEYGLADLWGMTRVMRTAPVSREMVLNFVAEHSLGLPRSY